ncbi:recombinase family protein [uncultured Rhodoblastus sp.]|uniref:recombinase family protein n=1 Tax=uncultured Rhodoblastus sp. TaxID=543037 RepID=UPI0025F84481|nr:recombinase family protein [uncultured Rhodoblastus sp.]
MNVGIYARFSSTNQKDASIPDQFRDCHAKAKRENWQVTGEHSDPAISGKTFFLRPGIQALIAGALKGRYQIVLAESLDRLSRDMEDIAGLFKRLTYAGVKIFTLAEGEITPLHVGLKGAMNEIFLKDLAEKTFRGLRGRVDLGKSGGGNAYGYSLAPCIGSDGKVERGARTINPVEAAIILRIFRDHRAGKSGKRIAVELNREGIAAPRGGEWSFSTINGSAKRGNGILNNEMYIGRLVWNRQHFVSNPDTGKRQARLNPSSEWIVTKVPEWRIVDDELWHAVKARQAAATKVRDSDEENNFRDRRRPKYLFSGLAKCGCCRGGYTMISATLVGCATARNKGTCDNRVNIRSEALESRIVGALRENLMDPTLFKVFCEEFTRELNLVRTEARSGVDAAKTEIKRIDRELDTLLNIILKGGAAERINAKMVELEQRKKQLEQKVAEAGEAAPLLHPEMATFYRREIEQLHNALADEDETHRLEALEIIRSLIDAIILTPDGDGALKVEVRGDLAGILTIASASKPARNGFGGGNAKSRPGGAASGCDLASQVEMVAGTGFEPVTFRL